ncbi:MAG TPA: uracil-DNA glycosylase family protein [Gemmatimonadaceae bacterium]|nr:uracil-DNA glycosylase family protein [Gemmatimonadaceae bacterium]
MDAKDLLRRYLEQRREMGESEFVLDSMSVADAMRVLGAKNPGNDTARHEVQASPPAPPRAAPTPTMRANAPEASDDWRATLRAAGAGPSATAGKVAAPPVTAPTPSAAVPATPTPSEPAARTVDTDTNTGNTDAPPGLVVGSPSKELFGGPLSSVASLDDIAKLVASCTGCSLHSTARNPVPGEGNPRAELVCVGEAPGQTEDEQGRPFVGAAGQLLTKILEAGMEIPREKVFICNVLKHRPPGNRNPAPDEIVACRPFLMRQLELIRPKVILALGTFAAQTLLETKLAIGKLRGQVHRFYGIPLVVTYHPAALLRNPAWKRPTYDDVKLARRLLERPNDRA